MQAESPNASPASTSSPESVSSAAKSQLRQLPEAASGTATKVRSFRDVFAPEPTEVEAPAAEKKPPVFELLEAAQEEQEVAASTSQRDPTAGEKLISPEFGYAAISGSLPSKKDRGGLLAAHPKLHPQRMFMPGDTYEPEELNPFHKAERGGRTMPSPQEALAYTDFRNVAFLERFLSPAGRLLPRKVTKLPPSVQAAVMREVKLARTMGFIAGETRLEKSHLKRVREAEERMRVEQRGSS